MIVRVSALDDLPRLPRALAQPRCGGWWQLVRDRFLAGLQARTPQLAQRWLNTQQQVDGAIAAYEGRYTAVNQLVAEAESVLRELTTQADRNQQAAGQAGRRVEQASSPELVAAGQREQRESQQAAEELLALRAEQEQELRALQVSQREFGARLEQLRGQRALLRARLQSAQAEIHSHGVRPRPWARNPRVWVSAGLVLLAFVAVLTHLPHGAGVVVVSPEPAPSTASPLRPNGPAATLS